MKKFIRKYTNPNESQINYGLINREYDGDLVDYIVDCCKSLEVLQYIKLANYEYITDESKIDMNEYITAKARKNKNPKGSNKTAEAPRYMYLEDSRYGELRLTFDLDYDGKHERLIKKILVPVPDPSGYYLIKGTKYILMYQVVDNSTYTTKKSLTLKSMMPIAIQVNNVKFDDTTGNQYIAPIYTLSLFKKNINILLFYLATFGIDMTLEYFSVDRIIRFTSSDEKREGALYFTVSSKFYLEVNKMFFDKYLYVRTITFMLLSLMTNRMNFEFLNDKDYWIQTIGSYGTATKTKQYEKGINTLTFINRMLDNTTKRILKIHPVHKQDIFSILRWLIMHFNDLRKKDNMDLNNRRLRCNEYIAALLSRTLGDKVNRIISMGNRATMKDIVDIFTFPGDILTSQLHKSQLLQFDDRVNSLPLTL